MAANEKAAPGTQPGTALKSTSCTANTTPCTTALEALVEQFRSAMRSHGIATDERIVGDGVLHRVRAEGDKRGTRNGWYVLHLDGIPAGAFGHWKAGSCSTWRADIGRKLDLAEITAHRARMTAARAQRDARQAQNRIACRERAAKLWKAAGAACSNHPYLRRKGVGAHSLRQRGDLLIVPVLDLTGTIHGLQFISPDGSKRYLTGTAKAGCLFFLGSPPQADGELLAIAEGYATAATVAEATGWATFAAFDAGNLESVAKVLRARYPSARIVISADHDHGTPGNPGLAKGGAAARAVGGTIAAPAFRAGDAGTDWNDYSLRYGMAATAAALLAVVRNTCHVA